MRCKLCRVDEDRNYGMVIFLERSTHYHGVSACSYSHCTGYSPREACPSCRAPIVATKPTDFFSSYAFLLHSLYEATEDKIGMADSVALDDIARSLSPGSEWLEMARKRPRSRLASIDGVSGDNRHACRTPHMVVQGHCQIFVGRDADRAISGTVIPDRLNPDSHLATEFDSSILCRIHDCILYRE